MKRKVIAIFYFFFAFIICKAQTISDPGNNSLSFELGKSGLIYNLNFDHKFRNSDFGFRIGAGSNFAKYLQALTGGVGGYYLQGHKSSFLELGIDLAYLSVDEVSDDQKGFSLIYPDYSVKAFYATANVGYRRYGKHTLFRIGVSPGFIKNEFFPGGYISFGFIF
jgi:hypothetical protein